MSKVNQVERAARAWPVLLTVAKSRKTITYGELAEALGIHPRPIRYVLGVIQDYCLAERLPPLTILAVNKGGQPGAGFVAHEFNELVNAYKEVWEHNWGGLENPFEFSSDGTSLEDLQKLLVREPAESEEVYTRVKSRGIRQLLFRNAVLQAYKNKCAFTGIGFLEGLEACHIVPWAQATPAQRLDVRNGILLNSFHHRLFDRGLITFSENYTIHFVDANSEKRECSEMEAMLTSGLHGKKMHVPFQKKQRPLADYIKQHHAIQEWEI